MVSLNMTDLNEESIQKAKDRQRLLGIDLNDEVIVNGVHIRKGVFSKIDVYSEQDLSIHYDKKQKYSVDNVKAPKIMISGRTHYLSGDKYDASELEIDQPQGIYYVTDKLDCIKFINKDPVNLYRIVIYKRKKFRIHIGDTVYSTLNGEIHIVKVKDDCLIVRDNKVVFGDTAKMINTIRQNASMFKTNDKNYSQELNKIMSRCGKIEIDKVLRNVDGIREDEVWFATNLDRLWVGIGNTAYSIKDWS